jgi:4-carboxymuconolactone decarboxylase
MHDTGARLAVLDAPTVQLVQLAATIAVGDEPAVRRAFDALRDVPPSWVEEVILQSYLFAGFPRTLNAAREWRRVSGVTAPAVDADAEDPANASAWLARGEVTCSAVYGGMYTKLRENIRTLHPALDAWMVTDGYGKVLSRPALDLVRRELCIVAVCAAARQDRQLHSHLHGALNVGAHPSFVAATLDAVAHLLDADSIERYRLLWRRVAPSTSGEVTA